MIDKHNCPVCGKYEFESWNSFDICEYCGWEDDAVQLNNPDYTGGANKDSLNEYKAKYESGWRPEWLNEEEN